MFYLDKYIFILNTQYSTYPYNVDNNRIKINMSKIYYVTGIYKTNNL